MTLSTFELGIVSKYLNSTFDIINFKKINRTSFNYVNENFVKLYKNNKYYIYDLDKIIYSDEFIKSLSNISTHEIYIINKCNIEDLVKFVNILDYGFTIYLCERIEKYEWNPKFNIEDKIPKLKLNMKLKHIRFNYNCIFYNWINIEYLIDKIKYSDINGIFLDTIIGIDFYTDDRFYTYDLYKMFGDIVEEKDNKEEDIIDYCKCALEMW